MAVANESEHATQAHGLRARFYRHFQSFSSTTQFHGFGQIVESGNWLEQSVWLFILIVCFVLTIKDVGKSFQQYVDGETTSTTTMKTAESIEFPNASLCVDIDVERFSFGGLIQDAKNVTEVREYLRGNLDAFACIGLVFNEKTGQKECKNYIDDDSNNAALEAAVHLTTLLITTLTNADSSLFYQPDADDDENTASLSGVTPFPGTVREMHKFYTSHGITHDWPRLGHVIAQLLCEYVIPFMTRAVADANGKTNTNTSSLCPQGAHYWLGRKPFTYDPTEPDRLCVRLDADALSFSATSAAVFAVFPSRNYRQNGTSRAASEEVSTAVASLNVDARSVAGIAESPLSNCVNLYLFDRHGKPAEMRRNIQVLGEYNAYSGGGVCSDDAIPFDCRAEVRNDATEALCSCRSFAWSKTLKAKNSTLPFCGTLFLTSTNKSQECTAHILEIRNRTLSREMNECMKESCTRKVVAFLYDELPNEARNTINTLKNEFVINAHHQIDITLIFIMPNGYMHPYVEETLKVGLADLFANLGGNLSLWLGGSFIALLHLVIFPMRVWLCGARGDYAEDRGGSKARGRGSIWQKTFDDIELADINQVMPSGTKVDKEQLMAAMQAYLRDYIKSNVESSLKEATNGAVSPSGSSTFQKPDV